MSDALAVLKASGPIAAVELGKALGLTEKQTRGQIDRLRRAGEPVWLDVDRGFWWSDEWRQSGIAHAQWKRRKA